MWFDPYDTGDGRVAECPLTVPAFPVEIGKAPEDEGLYVLLDRDYHVLYIGQAGAEGLRAELQAKRCTRAAQDVHWFLWIRTRNRQEAGTLKREWVRKYRPRNGLDMCAVFEGNTERNSKVLPFRSSGARRMVQ